MTYMNVMTYSDARANLKDVMDRVVEDRAPTVVARRKGGSVVIVSLADWNAQAETDYLLSNPANAKRLRRSLAQIEAGEVTTHPWPSIPDQ